MTPGGIVAAVAPLAHLAIVAAVTVRVVDKRPAPGVAMAWLFLTALVPFVGGLAYLLIGERRISTTRARRIAALRPSYEASAKAAVDAGFAVVDWSRHDPAARGMDTLGRRVVGLPTLRGNRSRLEHESESILASIARDIDGAQRSVLMEFYIWNAGGKADVVLEALERAAQRGVDCRVLVDALGARPWWKTGQPARLRAAGVSLRPALPVSLLRTVARRMDLRLHRKIVVIDGTVAWTGSMNLVDPTCFKQDAGVGQWVDAMVRVEGPVVAALGGVMLGDWVVETGEPIEPLVERAGLRGVRPVDDADAFDAQAVPSGPVETSDGLLQLMLSAIGAAREEIVLTTPYFVPDDTLLAALRGAAGRGVSVKLVLPERVDSTMTRYASRSYYDELMDLGVEIHLFKAGLLHTKSIVVDRAISMFGTANLDMRSLWLNYEVSLFVYGRRFGNDLRALHDRYLADSERVDPDAWSLRSRKQRWLENAFRLAGPLL